MRTIARGGRRAPSAVLALVLLATVLASVGVQGAASPSAAAAPLTPFRGMGTWVDVYDWSNRYGGATPAVGPSSVDRMADVGVTTLYLQTTTPRAGVDLLEPDRLRAIVARAHARGISVVGWYVPTLVDPAVDLRRLTAMTSLGVDGVGVDIEDLSVSDTNERNRRIVSLSAQLRAALPGMPLSAITLDAVHLDVINRSYWPSFPWAELAPHYDVVQPMAYWTNRTTASGYRDGYRYIAENIDRIRAHTGRPDLPIHPIGGLASLASTSDLQGMVLAAGERGAIGLSLYDWVITPAGAWPVLRMSGGDPFGNVEQVAGGPRSVVVGGWAIDPDTAQPIDVHVYVDGVGRGVGLADGPRPDLPAHFPDWGPNHGFRVQVGDLAPGPHDVCTFAISKGRGTNRLLDCRRVVVPTGSPFGVVEEGRPGLRSLRVSGWALDPDSAGPIEVHVYVDGVGRANVRADRPRPDVDRAHPGWDGTGGFVADVLDVPPGPHSVCTFAIDVGAGENQLLRCSTVVVGHDPGGVLDAPTVPAPQSLSVTGWAADPDTASPIRVHVYVDGVGRANVLADLTRPDAAAAVPALGPNHGFATTVTGLTPGSHEVCAFAIDEGPGTTTVLGCRTAIVPGGPPIGNLEAVRAGPRSVRLSGWALEPDTTAPVQVHVYVDGVGRANVLADQPRPDLAPHFPGWGTGHGFDLTVGDLGPGSHTACAFAVDPVPPGASTLLRCQAFDVPSGDPMGNVEVVEVAPGRVDAVRVAGWALDPDTADATEVHVYVDGVGAANVVADLARPDVAALFPGWGEAHGFDVTVGGLSNVPHTVCTFAIDRRAPGENRLLRCQDVVMPVPPLAPAP